MALCVAFCCVTAYISFPLPFTPGMVTALTLALGVTAFVLPPKQTFIALFIYVLLGCIGLPEILPGRFVKIDRVDSLANKKYYVTRVTHTYDRSGFTTRLEAEGWE